MSAQRVYTTDTVFGSARHTAAHDANIAAMQRVHQAAVKREHQATREYTGEELLLAAIFGKEA